MRSAFVQYLHNMKNQKIHLIEHPQKWEKFIKKQENSLFIQAPAYGDFYETLQEKQWIIGVIEDDEIIAGSLVLSVHAKRGNFLYLPYGPIVSDKCTDEEREVILDYFFSYLKKFALDKKFDFIKASPFIPDSEPSRNMYARYGFRPSPMHILAETTWILDVAKSEEELMREMKKNHRNLIRRCNREGVVVEKSSNKEDLQGLNSMMDATALRHNFVRFSNKYIENEFEVFSRNNNALVFNAYLPDGRLDASAVIIFYGAMAAYRHSASLNLDKRLPTSYALQWEVIKEVKRRGIKYYNFWGIAPDDSPKTHPFYGITHFKKGFGGFQQDLLHCHDMPLTWKYWFNWLVESVRKIKRGF